MGIEPLGTSGVAISIRHHIYLNPAGTTKGNLGGTGSIGARPADRPNGGPGRRIVSGAGSAILLIYPRYSPPPVRGGPRPARRRGRATRRLLESRSGRALAKASDRPWGARRCLVGPAPNRGSPGRPFPGRTARSSRADRHLGVRGTRGPRRRPGSNQRSDDDRTSCTEFRAAARRNRGCRRTRPGDLYEWQSVC